MASERVVNGLAWFVGGTFVVMGIVEVGVRVVSADPIEVDATEVGRSCCSEASW